MFQANIVPGQGFIRMEIYQEDNQNVGGRIQSGIKPTGKTFFGMVTSAPQKEVEEWKQLGHPIDHIIISSDAMVCGEATNYLITEDGRKFYVEGIEDPAGLGISIAYYVQERMDGR